MADLHRTTIRLAFPFRQLLSPKLNEQERKNEEDEEQIEQNERETRREQVER